MCNILFVGGGSVGHIAPAVAVWQEFLKAHPKAQAHFICSERGEDADFLQEHNLCFTAIRAPRLSLGFPWKFLSAYRDAARIIEKLKPDILFSKGGYVSVPACLAAHRKGIPIVLHESDVVSGNANWLTARWATVTCSGFPSGGKQKGAYTYTGNPVRTGVSSGSREEGLRITGLSGTRPVLLVMGGSQGAQALNQIVLQHLQDIQKTYDVIHITGRGKEHAATHEGYWAQPFVKDNLKHIYRITDVALSRAGAGSIGELAINGIPSILVPLRGVGHDHQQKNAEYVAGKKGCVLLQQTDLAEKLLPLLQELAENRVARTVLAESIRRVHQPDAARRICQILEETLSKKLNRSSL